MLRSIIVALAVAGAAASASASPVVTRERVTGDVYHYRFTLPLGTGPNARIQVHRVVRERLPGLPRPTTGSIVLMHGDFSSFDTNFVPSTGGGLAPWLAERGVDVWGIDRRWALAPEVGADLSDFDAMSLDQELDDLEIALAFVRTVRALTGAGADRVTLSGFSRGGMLAYFYAAGEEARPPLRRHLKGLVPLDVYASLPPDAVGAHAFNCATAAGEYEALAAGVVDVPNELQATTGRLALADPAGQSPFFAFPVTNREWFLSLVGETYFYFPATRNYHLNAPLLDADRFVVGLTASDEEVIATWLAEAVPHQSMRESADTDALICGDAPRADLALAHIQVPLFAIAVAGGYGARALHSPTQVSSTDVTTLLIRRLPVEREPEDFGHADLLFAPDAPALAWQPLLAWLRAH